MATEQSSP
ncbi:unnamed protein product, partial [Rotaria sordida]